MGFSRPWSFTKPCDPACLILISGSRAGPFDLRCSRPGGWLVVRAVRLPSAVVAHALSAAFQLMTQRAPPVPRPVSGWPGSATRGRPGPGGLLGLGRRRCPGEAAADRLQAAGGAVPVLPGRPTGSRWRRRSASLSADEPQQPGRQSAMWDTDLAGAAHDARFERLCLADQRGLCGPGRRDSPAMEGPDDPTSGAQRTPVLRLKLSSARRW